MSPTATRDRGLRLRDRRHGVADLLVAALALAILLAAGVVDRPPSFIDRVEVVNPTMFHVEVEVRGDGGGGWMTLGAVRRESSRTVEDVLDQGDRWRVRFRYGGRHAGELTLGRAEARRIAVPPEVDQRLVEAGFTPSAF